MSAFAATTLTALLLANPSMSDASRVAADGGFLLGNAHRCGIAGDRIVEAGQLISDLIAAAAEDGQEQEEATTRFARFFMVSAVVEETATKTKAAPSCRKVAREFARFERHNSVASDSGKAEGRSAGRHFRLGDGE